MARSRRKTKAYEPPTQYWDRSQQPLQSLIFLLPLLILYELGVVMYHDNMQSYPLVAVSWLKDFLEVFGIGAYYMPPLIVAILLLSWHVVRKDRWYIEWKLYGAMLIEAAILALPLLVLLLILFRGHAAPAAAGEFDALPWQSQVILSIGAGIYEELVFRLIGIALAHTLLVDVLALPEKTGAIGAILLCAIVFSAAHFLDGSRSVNVRDLAYFTLAGVYFAAVYLLRGFGIVAGTHAMFDVYTILLRMNFT